MDYKDDKVCDFIAKLASDSAVPGGGGAAALTAALSSALSSMVFNLTVGKKSYEALSEDIKAMVNSALLKCKNMNMEFQDYISKDGEAFSALMEAYKLPKDSVEHTGFRETKIEEGLNKAMGVPFSLAKEIIVLFEYIDIAAQYGNKNVISDAGVSAILAYAAVESCILNVKVNLQFISNKDDVMMDKCCELLKTAKQYKDRIMEKVYSMI